MAAAMSATSRLGKRMTCCGRPSFPTMAKRQVVPPMSATRTVGLQAVGILDSVGRGRSRDRSWSGLMVGARSGSQFHIGCFCDRARPVDEVLCQLILSLLTEKHEH